MANPYIYCGNNPIMYMDPNGEFFWIPILIGAAISALSYTIQVASSEGGFSNWNWGDFGRNVLIGGVSGLAGGWAAGAVGKLFSVQSGFFYGAATGAAGGAAGGFTAGTAGTWTTGGGFGEGLTNGFVGAGIGTATGGVIGGSVGGLKALSEGNKFWNGQPIITPAPAPVSAAPSQTTVNTDQHHSVYLGTDDEGVVRYVGRTGREPELRFKDHLKATGTGREKLNYKPIKGNLTLEESKVLEQTLINQHGGPKGGQLLNKINSVAPTKWDGMGIQPMTVPPVSVPSATQLPPNAQYFNGADLIKGARSLNNMQL